MEKKKATAAHMRATAKWEAANYDRVVVRFPKDMHVKDRISALGSSINGYIIRATLEHLDRDENNHE